MHDIYYYIDTCERFLSARKTSISPSEIKTCYCTVTSQYQRHHNQKYHWESNNENKFFI